MHVFSRIYRIARHHEVVRRRAFAAHGLADWEFDVLAALRRSGEPFELTPGRLVSETLVSSGTMTNRVDRLAERGLVERRASASDRRLVLVRLSPTGRSRVDAAVADLMEAERPLLDHLDPDDAAHVASLLRTVLGSIGT